MTQHHEGHKISECGFSIHPTWPFLGATPDGRVSCPACGSGCVEVKCPHCVLSFDEAIDSRRDFCLERNNETQQFNLKRTHQYYYQVQLQLAVTQCNFCDFVVWLKDSIHIERIHYDSAFFLSHLPRVTDFFKKCVLPELLSKWFTLGHGGKSKEVTAITASPQLACFCQEPIVDGMVKCNAEHCVLKYYHVKCLGLKHMPNPKTYMCPSCRKVANAEKRARKKAAE